MKSHNFSKHKFRASGCGHLMVNPRGKGEVLSETTKKYLLESYINVVYGRKKDTTSKYTIKGLLEEDSGITLLSRLRHEFLVKNEEFYQNDFLTGTPDIISDGVVYDIKNSWSIFTFMDAVTGPINPIYMWQMQAYLDLTGLSVAYLVYTLNNTPDVLIEAEKRKFAWQRGVLQDEITEDDLRQIEKLCKYDDIPMEDRVHIIEVKRDQSAIDSLHARIAECRAYMNEKFNK